LEAQEFRIYQRPYFISSAMPDLKPLDNPIWNALNTEHSTLALGDGRARRYPADIGPLSGLADQSDASYEALRELAGLDGMVGLFLTEPPVLRPGWTLIRGGELDQMICMNPESLSTTPMPPNATSRLLTPADVPEMVALAELTEPGPFRNRTIELGVFYGIFDSARLVAMAGQRLHLPEFVEVSAVCTHPDARGRGYARALMAQVIQEMQQRGKTPILHTFADNQPAIRVYEGLGFTLRRTLHLAVLKNEA
jgi:ribosomal protein S18 acetylase RimI-like enzyme